ncbi:hypothetical protein OIY81_1490 [Cryptosporidium canis]|uniref:C2H2-type domain-containing protein n=1 Tax=Cryptosporidium canis TaxID=195482 RepID=A0ABQ8P452_9CRYT|nr:hypothetical protein OJ252_2817 [Cryptosporidium canis]KAJ1611984.1 hypothetical protein OIY81_1490 [Cryptosporidium canis]
MWQDTSINSFANSCLNRLEDCFHHESSTVSPQLMQSCIAPGDSEEGSHVQRRGPPMCNLQLYAERSTDNSSMSIDQQRVHNSYRNFLNMDRVMPWMSSADSLTFPPSSSQQPSRPPSPPNNLILNSQFTINSSSIQSPNMSTPFQNSQQQPIFSNFNRVDDFKCLDKMSLFTEHHHPQLGLNGIFNTSPVKSDTSTATPSSMRSIINEGFFNSYQDDRKSSIPSYFSSGVSSSHGYGLGIAGGSNMSSNLSSMAFNTSNGNLNFGGMEHYRMGDVPPLSFSCLDKNRNEAYYTQASNLLKILSPSWILCIDIAAILLTNTDNKMALSNIGPKLSCFARDALRQIKQKKLSRFIKEHSNFFDIRRPSPTHSALYVTLKFPLPNVIQQFLPSIVQLRKYELERTQMNNHLRVMNEVSENDLEQSQNVNSALSTVMQEEKLNTASKGTNACLLSENTDNKLECTSVSNKQQLENSSNQKKSDSERICANDQIPSSVKSYQAYECWLCVREFANVLIHQPTHTMELREIGVLMSQKAKIQAKRNSSKKNYKSFLLSYPKLFRIFGKDDNHSIQWIGSNQDFIKLNSIKFQPAQSDEELFNVPTLNQSHLQFLFNLNNCSVSL